MESERTCVHLNKVADVFRRELWHNKEALRCLNCKYTGTNLWLCLHPYCHYVGCLENGKEHITKHYECFPHHYVHINVSSERIWCYKCNREVFMKDALARLKYNKDLISVASSGYAIVEPQQLPTAFPLENEDPQLEDENGERFRGLVGIQNMGNTCYMNAALQALSHTPPLTNYFLECAASVAVLTEGKKPGLIQSYQKLVRDLWRKKSRGYVVPTSILQGIKKVHSMFTGYQQHDTQEFLRCLLDGMHEELKEPVTCSLSKFLATSDADGDHTEPVSLPGGRRTVSSEASDSMYGSAFRRSSPARSTYSEPRNYSRRQQDCAKSQPASSHKRSASFAGTHANYTALNSYAQHNHVDHAYASSDGESCSSGPEDNYQTCSSCSSIADTTEQMASGDSGTSTRYRSVISDVFNGLLMSSVQCLNCQRVSRRVETFQDLSLPIPSRDQLSMLRQQPSATELHQMQASHDSWLWWMVGWLRSWLYGPVLSLQDCLAAFFSADELKGDNMYSCSRCKKLRNGVKMSGVLHLPEVLSIHLKRFRHELMFSSKVSARVDFPLHDLDMAPYTHKECRSKVTRYELSSFIVHTGTAGGGHYTCVARNEREWCQFDDHSVVTLTPQQVAASEAYVLFYRKVNPQMESLRQKATILLAMMNDTSDVKYYISKSWYHKFRTWAEPGPIDNTDFLCLHGGIRPDRTRFVPKLAKVIPQELWDLLYGTFGGGPACTHLHHCAACLRVAANLQARKDRELDIFCELHSRFQNEESKYATCAISMQWFRQWESFVKSNTLQPPQPLDNSGIVTKQEVCGVISYKLKPGSDYAPLSEELWRFFVDTYGGGPEVKLRPALETEDTGLELTTHMNGNITDSDSESKIDSSTKKRKLSKQKV